MRSILKRIRIALLRLKYERELDAVVALRHSRRVSGEGLRIMQERCLETLKQINQLKGV